MQWNPEEINFEAISNVFALEEFPEDRIMHIASLQALDQTQEQENISSTLLSDFSFEVTDASDIAYWQQLLAIADESITEGTFNYSSHCEEILEEDLSLSSGLAQTLLVENEDLWIQEPIFPMDEVEIRSFHSSQIEEALFSLSPNPNQDYTLLRALSSTAFERLEVVNSIGEVIFNEEYTSAQKDILCDVSQWKTGVYFFRVLHPKDNSRTQIRETMKTSIYLTFLVAMLLQHSAKTQYNYFDESYGISGVSQTSRAIFRLDSTYMTCNFKLSFPAFANSFAEINPSGNVVSEFDNDNEVVWVRFAKNDFYAIESGGYLYTSKLDHLSYIRKFSSQGEQLWERNFFHIDGIDTSFSRLSCPIQLPNNSILTVGVVGLDGSGVGLGSEEWKLVFVNLDTDGNTNWMSEIPIGSESFDPSGLF